MLINNYNIDVSKFQQNSEDCWIRKFRGTTTLFNNTHKSCNECKEIKSFENFDKLKHTFLYLYPTCKKCRIEKIDQEKKKEYGKQYRQENKIEIKQKESENTEKRSRYYKQHSRSNAKYNENRLPLGYDTRNKEGLLQVRCYKCNRWMFVTNRNLGGILQAQKGNLIGQSNLYCSDECKKTCSEYHNKTTNREFEAFELGLSLFEYNLLKNSSKDLFVIKTAIDKAKERDNYECQKCGDKNNLHGHHIIPIALCLGTDNEYMIYETSNIITVCHKCHKKEHEGELSLGKLKGNNKVSICLM